MTRWVCNAGWIVVLALSMSSGLAYADCCQIEARRTGPWAWRPVGWSWDAGLWWRPEGPGAPLWGYQTCYRPRQVPTPWGWTWRIVRVC
jgi:hypothetical protein